MGWLIMSATMVIIRVVTAIKASQARNRPGRGKDCFQMLLGSSFMICFLQEYWCPARSVLVQTEAGRLSRTGGTPLPLLFMLPESPGARYAAGAGENVA